MSTQTDDSNKLSLVSLTTVIIIQLIAWIFWGAWFTFSTRNNTSLLEDLAKENLPTRMSVVESKVNGYDRLISKMNALSLQIAKLEGVMGRNP